MNPKEINPKDLISKVEKLKGVSVLVIGDVGLDEYVMGSVHRISPEAPVPVVEVASEDFRLGLSANVTQNITSLGGSTILVSVVGDDEAAKSLRGLLKEQNVNTDYLVVDKERPTTRKLRVMSGQYHLVRVDYERRKFLSADIQKQLLAQVEKALDKCDAVILQDYAKGVLSESCIQSIIQLAKKAKKRVLVDPHRTTPVTYYRGADLIKPNRDEALLLAGRALDDIRGDNIEEVGFELMKKTGVEKLVITRGKEGVSLFEGSSTKKIPTYAKAVFDVTGAGDTMIAALAMSWAAGLSLEDSCYIANHAAGIVVGKIGCVPCTTSELIESIHSLE